MSNWTRTGAGTVPLPAREHDESHALGPPLLFLHRDRSGAEPSLSLGRGEQQHLHRVGRRHLALRFRHKRWREITVSTHPYNVFEQTMTYDPSTHRLVLFGGGPSAYDAGQDAWLFDVNSELWERAATASAPAQRMSHSMVYDSMRRLSATCSEGHLSEPGERDGGRSTPPRASGSGSSPRTPPVARRFAALMADSPRHRDDVGGIRDENTLYNDTWIYRPGTRQWQLVPPASPPSTGMNSEDLAYDPERRLHPPSERGILGLRATRRAATSESAGHGEDLDPLETALAVLIAAAAGWAGVSPARAARPIRSAQETLLPGVSGAARLAGPVTVGIPLEASQGSRASPSSDSPASPPDSSASWRGIREAP